MGPWNVLISGIKAVPIPLRQARSWRVGLGLCSGWVNNLTHDIVGQGEAIRAIQLAVIGGLAGPGGLWDPRGAPGARRVVRDRFTNGGWVRKKGEREG